MTAVTNETIEDAGIKSISEAAQYAPNTFFNEFTARKLSNPRFRGIGASPANPGVTTYVDGVPQLNANSSMTASASTIESGGVGRPSRSWAPL